MESLKTLEVLSELGVRDYCVAAGVRNAPLVLALEKDPRAQLFSFFDERSASFFALGRSLASGNPCVVVTTSGTAVAETLAAVIEAFYQRAPLIVLSADRPAHFRGSGAPQSIEQSRLLHEHCESWTDLVEFTPETLMSFHEAARHWNRQGPWHINMCLPDPLRSENLPPTSQKNQQGFRQWSKKNDPKMSQTLENPLVICGPMTPRETDKAKKFLREKDLVFFAECLSGLRGEQSLNSQLVRALPALQDHPVLRLGSVPTTSLWRDLEVKSNQVISVSEKPWTGLGRTSELLSWDQAFAGNFFQSAETKKKFQLEKALHNDDETAQMAILFEKWEEHFAELCWYLGNSLPVRSLDRVAFPSKTSLWLGNRGANGIDGQLSTFLGWASKFPQKICTAVVGDLTALYDLQSLWISPQLKNQNLKIVVVNNMGGQIFSRFESKNLVNPHELSFAGWASMFGWGYWRGRAEELKCAELPTRCVVELLVKA